MEDSSDAIPAMAGRRAPYTQVGNWVMLHPDLSRNARLLYVYLAMYVNVSRGDSVAWPSRKSLASLLGYTKPEAVDPLLKELTKVGAVEIQHRTGKNKAKDTNVYLVHDAPPPGYKGPEYPSFGVTLKRGVAPSSGGGVAPSSGGGVAPSSGGGVAPSSGYELKEVELKEVELETQRTPRLADASPGAAPEIIEADAFKPGTYETADTTQTILAGWIDYCAARNVQLTGRIKGQYAKRIKAALEDKIDVLVIKRALASMAASNVAHQPSWLDNHIISVQTGPERPRERASSRSTGANIFHNDRDRLDSNPFYTPDQMQSPSQTQVGASQW